MRRTMVAVSVLGLLFLGGCGALAAAQGAAEKAGELVDQARGYVAQGEAWIRERKAEIDTNRDDKVSTEELLKYLLGLVGGGGLLAAGVNKARKTRTDELYDEAVAMKERLTRLESGGGSA